MFEKMPETGPKKHHFDDVAMHEERWEHMAGVHAQRNILMRVWERNKEMRPESWSELIRDRNEKMTPEDFMLAEAKGDDKEFEKKKYLEKFEGEIRVRMKEEFEMWEKNLKVVIERIKLAKENPENGEYRPLLLILGGGMKGPYSAGQVLGLHLAGIPPEVFKNIVGISAGAASASYYVAGLDQTRRGASLFYEECTTPEFLDLKRVRRMMDVAKLALGWMSHGEKKLDVEAVRKCGANLWYGVTRPIRGRRNPKEEFVNAKTAEPGMVNAMQASMSVPIFAGEVPPVNGIEYNDGAFDPMPIEAIIEQFNPTDILIFPNMPFETMDTFNASLPERCIASLAGIFSLARGSMLSLGQVEKFMLIKEQLRESMEFIQKEKKVNIGMMFPPNADLGTTTQDSRRIKAAESESARDVITHFDAKQPQSLGLYETEKMPA